MAKRMLGNLGDQTLPPFKRVGQQYGDHGGTPLNYAKKIGLHYADLWQSRCCLKEIEGLHHSAVNTTLATCGDLPMGEEGPCLSFFIWQYGKTKVVSFIKAIP
ncbi:Arginine N-methyltransferase [Forsythia ovata]|uniref:Arginine N-methyltransferase n=1 Tax=Forsythia ovata TaxID=205694 RepID=A0ABD1VL49_9LAMI